MISILDTGKKKPEERRLPEPDLFASCPYDGPILPYYQGQFDAVYALLHPFIRAVSLDKELFYPETYPSKSEILTKCRRASWSDIIDLTSLANISEIDIGLRTGIAGLNKEFCNDQFAEQIDRIEEIKNIIRPNEGELPELLQIELFEALQSLGHEWLWIGDEFCTERKLEWIDDLKGDYLFPSHCCVFTPDKSILVTTHWDSHFSFLCSTRETIDKILNFEPFEGFFCDQSTEVYWSLRS